MNEIMMVDGYEAPSFDAYKKKSRKRRVKKARKGTKKARKAAAHRSPAYLCAGAKRLGACKRAVKARKRCKK